MKLTANDVHAMSLQIPAKLLGTKKMHTKDDIDMTELLTHFILETPKGVLAKSADPDQMPHNVASDLGLHYFESCSAIFQQKFSINIT